MLNAGVEGLGVLNASVGVGAFGSALFLALQGNRLPNRGVLLLVTTCAGGATIAAFALSSSYHLSIALMMLFGLISMTQMTLTATVMQLMVPRSAARPDDGSLHCLCGDSCPWGPY